MSLRTQDEDELMRLTSSHVGVALSQLERRGSAQTTTIPCLCAVAMSIRRSAMDEICSDSTTHPKNF